MPAYNMGFCASWEDGINLNICATIWLQFQLDVINLAYEQIISSIAIINFGYGQTEFYFPTCTKPQAVTATQNSKLYYIMNLSSRTTYLFPFILLLIPSFYLLFFRIDFYSYELIEYSIYFLEPSIVAAILFFMFRKSVGILTKYKFLKYLLILIPTLISILVTRFIHLDFLAIVAGLFLFFSYSVFSNRYTGVLTEEAIKYKNLLGQTGEINLKDIVKLEQKKNLLSIFREIKILDFSRKTGITFTDENLDEYGINIFTKVLKANTLFSAIIEKANKCGNLKIRQYTV